MKLPCRLTQASMTGSSPNEGGRRRARAMARPPTHSTRHGQASRCGRASSDGPALHNASTSPVTA